jgi:hypothetical protein
MIVGGLAAALLISGLSVAYTQERQRSRSKTTVRSEERTSSTEVRRVSTVIGGKFVLQSDESFGKIEDIVINDAGCIDYVIIVHEDHFYPVPWGIVDVDFGPDVVVSLDMTRDRFLEGPYLSGWAEFSKSEWREKVTKHFGSERRERRGEGREERTDSPKNKREPRDGKADQPRERDNRSGEPKSKPAPKQPDQKKSDDKKSDDKKPDEKEKP